jgi:hypothetical protein
MLKKVSHPDEDQKLYQLSYEKIVTPLLLIMKIRILTVDIY